MKVLLCPSSLSFHYNNSQHHQLSSNCTSHFTFQPIKIKIKINKKGGGTPYCSVGLGFRPVCKGPWGGVERERDTHLEELTI